MALHQDDWLTEPTSAPATAPADEARISVFAFAIVLLRWWKVIVGLGIAGAILGLTLSLTRARVYKSEATFIPQGAETGAAAGLAAQFGLRTPASASVWGPPVYVELLHSYALLEPIAKDTFTVVEENRRASLMDLLKIKGPTPETRVAYAVQRLRIIVQAGEDRKLSAVRVSVTTDWPSLSLALVNRLVDGVNQFNLQTRKSQATAERQFADEQAAAAERGLRDAENRLQDFLQQNREVRSPQLTFTKDRLTRDVSLREQVYSSLLQNREEARIREVRDTPVITILEAPRLAAIGEARHSVRKGILTGFAWALIGIIIAFVSDGLRGLKRQPTAESREFFRMLQFGKKPRLAANRE